MSYTFRATLTASNHDYLNRPEFVKETRCVFCDVGTEGLISGSIESQCVNDTAVPFCETICDCPCTVNVNNNTPCADMRAGQFVATAARNIHNVRSLPT